MTTEVLRAIHGVEIFPVISLIVFVIVFGGVLIWSARLDRGRLDRFAQMPLDEREEARVETHSR